MGWKTSLIIIENPNNFDNEIAILEAIGKSNFQFQKETTLSQGMYPGDKSISIGKYNGNIIICEDYQITTKTLENSDDFNLTIEEQKLSKLFPTSEIIQVACHSVVNYHAYSLIKNGEKIRAKVISSETPLIELGKRMIEEEKIYSKSYQKNGANFWKDETDPDEEYTEDQLMEDFAFGIAKRRLGVFLDQLEGEKLLDEVPFNKYIKGKSGFFQKILKSFSK